MSDRKGIGQSKGHQSKGQVPLIGRETETQQHSNMIKGKHGKLKGTQNYNKTSEELFRTRPSLIKTFERKNEDYEKEYK